jgi:hypothetical protein
MVFKPLKWREFLKEAKRRNLEVRKTGFDYSVFDGEDLIATVKRQHPGEDNLSAPTRKILNQRLKMRGIKEI